MRAKDVFWFRQPIGYRSYSFEGRLSNAADVDDSTVLICIWELLTGPLGMNSGFKINKSVIVPYIHLCMHYDHLLKDRVTAHIGGTYHSMMGHMSLQGLMLTSGSAPDRTAYMTYRTNSL
jgi:hypothetical protein